MGCNLAPLLALGYGSAMAKQTTAKHKKPATGPNREPFSDAVGEDSVAFGYQSVAAEDKSGLVHDIFSSVANRYDLMNDLMSFGVHRLWKAAFIDWLKPRPDMQLLDVGGGTGDIAFRFLESGGRDVTVCDINMDMLKVGRGRVFDRGLIDQGLADRLRWVCGDGENLPIADQAADAFTISFCIRNVTHIDHALKEARRVLKPGGRFLCLEFSQVILPILDKLYDTYSFRVLPALGELVTQDREAYQYLAESIRRFPNQDAFAGMIAEAGFSQVSFRNLSGGIAAMHSAWRV